LILIGGSKNGTDSRLPGSIDGNSRSSFSYFAPYLTENGEGKMRSERCPKCNRLMIAMTDRKGRTEDRCVKCDQIDPMKTDAVRKWANSSLVKPQGGAGSPA
jgi:phage FluMu protein Com